MSELASWTGGFVSRQTVGRAQVPSWLAAMRQRAMQRFDAEGWPTVKQDAWHHTSLALLAQQSFALPTQEVLDKVSKPYTDKDAGNWMVFVDGAYAPALSRLGAMPVGVTLAPLAQALIDTPDLAQQVYGTEQDGATTAALNVALATDGAVLLLAKGATLDETLHLVFISASPGTATFPRNLIVAGAGSHAVVVEHYLGQGGGSSFTNTVTRLRLDADANVTHLKLQREDPQAFHLGALDVSQAGGSVLNSHSMSFGAKLARHDISTDFQGERCEALLNGLYYVDGKRHVDHHTVIRHSQPSCISREYYRGVLDDTARGIFGGRIFVSPGADKTDAVQRSDSLLLSRLAKADARPELEIYADDVKCAHGATVGQLDPTALFYLRARGLDEAQARHVLTYAFAAEAILRISPEPLRSRVTEAIRSLAPAELGDFS